MATLGACAWGLAGCATSVPAASSQLPENSRLFEYRDGRIVTVTTSNGACSMAFQGRITTEFEATFQKAMAEVESQPCSSRRLTLDSGGGLVLAALKAGERIRQLGYTTEVAGWESGRCASACGLLFIAGVERVAKPEAPSGPKDKGAGLGVHQSSRRVGDSKVCLTDETPQVNSNARVKAYVERMLPAEGARLYLQLRMETDCRRMRYLTLDELLKHGIATRT